MELALSLGDASKPFTPSFLDKAPTPSKTRNDLDFRVGLGLLTGEAARGKDVIPRESGNDVAVPIQLDLLPFSPVIPRTKPPSRISWLAEPDRCPDPNRFAAAAEEREDSGATSFGISSGSGGGNNNSNKRDMEADAERDGSRGSDDDENGIGRKKLRLSKEQSAFLEESFKEQSTLNPKQKLALAKQLNLRPRQVEVWFQNRRARTKLKQTEIDCEYLKRCCDTLTEENKRLQKEVQELRALKTSQPFYKQLPATTLTMCPSCERVAATSSTAAAAAVAVAATPSLGLLSKPRTYHFLQAQAHKASGS